MSFLVIIIIAFVILIIIEKMLIFIESIRNQKVDIISDRYQLSVHKVITGLSVNYYIGAESLLTYYNNKHTEQRSNLSVSRVK